MSTASDAPPPELVERFRAALDRLNPEGEGIGLAVSGGPDSMAMLLLAHAVIPGGFEVATVNHGLRPEAKDECALVAAACEARGVLCGVLTVEVGQGNLQHEAREARYTALASWAEERGLAAIGTAHHADDQAETLLMRLNRGSGLAGLAGVRESVYIEELEIAVIRPVLLFRRIELAQVVASAGIEVAHDPSNEDQSFERVRIRTALAEADWIDPIAWAQSASHLAETEETMDYLAHQAWSEGVTHEAGGGIRVKCKGWRAVDMRLLDRGIRELGGAPRGKDVARLLTQLDAGGSGNVAGVQVKCAFSDGYCWVFRPEPPRKTG